MEARQSVAFGQVPGAEPMQDPEAVAAMLRLSALGWGSKRIARELGCNRATVKRCLTLGGWAPYAPRPRRGRLVGLEGWLQERFVQHRGLAACRRPPATAPDTH